MTEEDRMLLQAYADGVNDFLDGIGFGKKKGEKTSSMLPPEFLILGIKEMEPWTPIDSLALLRLINFGLTRNWSHELLRKIYKNLDHEYYGSLESIVDELAPFTSEFLKDKTFVLDESDMEQNGLLHPEGKSLVDRYKEEKER